MRAWLRSWRNARRHARALPAAVQTQLEADAWQRLRQMMAEPLLANACAAQGHPMGLTLLDYAGRPVVRYCACAQVAEAV